MEGKKKKNDKSRVTQPNCTWAYDENRKGRVTHLLPDKQVLNLVLITLVWLVSMPFSFMVSRFDREHVVSLDLRFFSFLPFSRVALALPLRSTYSDSRESLTHEPLSILMLDYHWLMVSFTHLCTQPSLLVQSLSTCRFVILYLSLTPPTAIVSYLVPSI